MAGCSFFPSSSEKEQTMMTLNSARRKSPPRRFLIHAALALLVLCATLITATVAFAQTGGRFALGCWAITSSGGGQRQSANFRISDATPPIGGQMTSPSAGSAGQPRRIQSNHLALRSAFRKPAGGPPQPPLTNSTVLFLPLVRDGSLVLQRLCK